MRSDDSKIMSDKMSNEPASADSFGLPRKPFVKNMDLQCREESKTSDVSNAAPLFKRSCTSIMMKGINSVVVQCDHQENSEESKQGYFEMQAAH